jgi:GH18 family chitinase
MSGLEHSLWQAEAGQKYGMMTLTERQATLLKLLSGEAGGWWMWGDDGAKFVSEDEWKSIAAKAV